MAEPRRRAERDRFYDRFARDPVSRRFYHSKKWKLARDKQLATHPVCQKCQHALAIIVHHVKPVKECTPAERVAPSNLFSVCRPCHGTVEAEAKAAASSKPAAGPEAFGIYEPDATDTRFYFDEEAADRVCRFIEKFCRHYEGKFSGKPFRLEPWQRKIIRDVFGWKWRATGLRRFVEVFIISAKGAGKTPWLAAIGLYCLLADKEPAAHVISMASSFEQANLTHDAGKKYIAGHEDLEGLEGLRVLQHAIEAPRWSKWTTISGKPNGRSGHRPSAIIADELHEWPEATAAAFDILTANLFKRSQPLVFMATNAGATPSGYAFTVYERARQVLAGQVEDVRFYPVIFEAPKALKWDSEAAAKAANPSLGSFVTFDQMKAEQAKGKARYERLFLSRWVTQDSKWIDVGDFDACSGRPLPDEETAGLPLYVGLDMSQGDDLCSAVYIYPTQDRFKCRASFWLPRRTADKYREKKGTPWLEWAKWGDINILPDATISTAVQERIAAEIIATDKVQKITAVCYDRAYSSHVIAALVAAKIECRPIRQGWSIYPGAAELKRRLTERTIDIEPNAVMRYAAENVEVKSDEHGNQWPIKPGARGTYAGKRWVKIDGIVALATGLTEARQHAFPKAKTTWAGTITKL